VTTRRAPDINASTKPQPPLVNNGVPAGYWVVVACPTCTLYQRFARSTVRCLPRYAALSGSRSCGNCGVTCGVCGEDGMAHNLWTCRFCGSVKAEEYIWVIHLEHLAEECRCQIN